MQINIFLLSALLSVGGSAEIYKKLHYFETLKTVSIASRQKRSADGTYTDSKEINFQALGRNFNLVLYPGSPVLAPDFQVKTVDRFGRKHSFHISPNEFFTGHLAEDTSVSVEAHFEDGILSSTITFPNETYAVEPAWRHLPPSDNHTMIAYRGSDVKWDELYPTEETNGKRKGMSDGIKLDQEETTTLYLDEQLHRHHEKKRHKRASGRKNLCPLLVVADYSFFQDIGKTREGSALYIVGVLNRVNERYKKTVWDSTTGLTGFGFQIKEMLIHTEYTDTPGHYNEKKNEWEIRSKLDAFSKDPRLRDFCLAHLYTSHSFAGNVLGLAFIASEQIWSAGGICSPTSGSKSGTIYPNTGWTSAKNKAGETLLTLQFELVNSHEFGHNWGAEHDPDTDECAPSSYKKGKYVMWAYAVTGWEDNNHVFSPCSKRWIAPVLESKAELCFTEEVDALSTSAPMVSVDDREEKHDRGTGLCGNGLIDKDEECDAGFRGDGREDPCCTADCKLKPGAVCSGVNYECCRNCQVAPLNTRCAGPLESVCKKEAVCNGKDLRCPPAGSADDGTDCLEKGKCYDGRCLSFCETRGREQGIDLTPCICDQNSTAACRFCCMQNYENGTLGSCEPTEEKLGNGRTCGFGYCQDGVCKVVQTNLVQRIFRFFTTVDISNIVQFMKTNIVGTVIVFSLIVWIPASWIFSCVDKRERREREFREYGLSDWASRDTSIIPPDFKEFKIKNSRFTRVPPHDVNGAAAVRHRDDTRMNDERFGPAPLAVPETSF